MVKVLRALVEHFADQPPRIPVVRRAGGLAGPAHDVDYVAGMTDRFAMGCAVTELGWDPSRLPRAVDGALVS